MPQIARLLGHEAERRHARLGVDLEQEQPVDALLVVPAEIGARGAAAAEQRDAPAARSSSTAAAISSGISAGQTCSVMPSVYLASKS